jgi:hypothetical protein
MKPQFCSIHLVFSRGCFEAILIENTPRTLGVKINKEFYEFIQEFQTLTTKSKIYSL